MLIPQPLKKESKFIYINKSSNLYLLRIAESLGLVQSAAIESSTELFTLIMDLKQPQFL